MSAGSSGSDGCASWFKWLVGVLIALLAAGSGIVALLNYFTPRPGPDPNPPPGPVITVPPPPGPAGTAPTVAISVSPPIVARGQPFTVQLTGADENGMASIWWWGDSTGDPELNKAHWFDCGGAKSCTRSSTAATQAVGMLKLCANSRDVNYPSAGQAHQASEGAGIGCAAIQITP